MGVFLAPSWSLAIEEQFYLALPLIVRFVKPRRLLPVLASLTGGIVALRVTFTYFDHAPQYELYTLPWFREDALLLGVICAIVMQRDTARAFLRNHWWTLAALALTAFATVLACGPTLYRPDVSPDASRALLAFGLSATAVMYAALLLLVLLFPALCAPLRLRPLSEVGKVSYCLYLIHTIVIEGGRKALLQYGDRWTLLQARFLICVAMFLMFMVAQLSWAILESKMLRIGHRFVFERPPGKTAPTLIETASA
jgi:peptidoglycan/LPS O-acetylase OafA/YrhL